MAQSLDADESAKERSRGFDTPSLSILTVDQINQADQLAIDNGATGGSLMARAGRSIFEVILRRWTRRPVIVLCGPGKNGGDGFVVARLLSDLGWHVDVYGEINGRPGMDDVTWARRYWGKPVLPIEHADHEKFADQPLVIDALFGAGLTRPVEGVAANALQAIAGTGCPIVAVDMPSGVDGDTGQLRGTVVQADVTVTFFRPKPGHLLLPGKAACGELIVADIGIEDDVMDGMTIDVIRNGSALWSRHMEGPGVTSHKYSRGSVLVYGGGTMAGAARLVSAAARRTGAGYVAAAVPMRARPIYATDAPGLVLLDRPMWRDALSSGKYSAFCIGPGAGIGDDIADAVAAATASGLPGVIDADALMSFERDPEALFDLLSHHHVLTPHDGEFSRLFPDLQGNKLFRARAAAERSGATMILKGADTVIALPDGRAVINDGAPSNLATAGSGDVLAGILTALLSMGGQELAVQAQAESTLKMASAAVWMHGEAAKGPEGNGLIAEDLIDRLPEIVTGI